jgi:ribosomal protein S8
MIKVIKLSDGIILERLHSKLGEIITWRMTQDGYIRGVIALKNNDWFMGQFSWHRFKLKYWIGYTNKSVITAKTRKELINILKFEEPKL